MPSGFLFVGSILIFVSLLVNKMGYKSGLPALLLFLFVGMLFGTDGLKVVEFQDAETTQFVGMIALSIILFSGGMDTKFKDIKPVMKEGVLLSTLGVLITTALTGLFIYYLSGTSFKYLSMPLMSALLMAATMSSTDSASVFNILRTQKMNLKGGLRPMLELESGSNDPMAYMLTIILIDAASSGDAGSPLQILIKFIVQFVVGGGLGLLLGQFAVWSINRINLTNSSLYSIFMLSLVFFTFTFTDMLGGNGYLAVYMAGIVCGNFKLVYRRETGTFMNGVTWLMQIAMFLVLGLLVNPKEMLGEAVPATLVGVFMMLVARPVSVFVCLAPFRNVGWKEKLFVSWVGLRGAVPIIFATYPILAGIEGANQLFNIVFFITILSLTIQGTTISWFAKKLGLDAPLEKEGNDFGIEMPDEVNTDLNDLILTEEMLKNGNTLATMKLPEHALVILIKRGKEFIVPNGHVGLKAGDKLLMMSSKERAEEE